MEYIVLLIIAIIIFIILGIMFDVNIKKIKQIGEDKELDILTQKYPENIEICKGYLRKLKNFYSSIVNNRSTKTRITEVNNSYFECHNLNYDSKDIQKRIDEITKEIEATDFEISKLNSIEFEI